MIVTLTGDVYFWAMVISVVTTSKPKHCSRICFYDKSSGLSAVSGINAIWNVLECLKNKYNFVDWNASRAPHISIPIPIPPDSLCISALSTLELNLYFLRSARVFLSVFLGFLSRQQQQAQAPQKQKINKYRNKWECAFCLCGDRKHFKFLCISSLLIDGFVITFTQQPINMLPQKRIRVYIYEHMYTNSS